jgi:D-glycero-alpha-D-manno-heptose-7-phosphate kinase
MIISKTPFRISFFGGGTDYPAWYTQHGGQVLSTSINKYCYICCRHYPPFFLHNFRLSYSKQENCVNIADIQHPAIRQTLRYLNWGETDGLEINQIGDLPARTGLGTSSAFVVGLINALYCLRSEQVSKHSLALQSIHIEQNLLKETVGSQDQTASAYGGLNHIKFETDGKIKVEPIVVSQSTIRDLESHLQLYYTGIQRTASEIAKSYIENMTKTTEQIIKELGYIVNDAISDLRIGDWVSFGMWLHDSWRLKKGMSDNVSNSFMDDMYTAARNAGAFGGKILGAGGGGFMLLLVPPEKQASVREVLRNFALVPFQFETSGSQIILQDRDPDFC